MNDVVKNSVTRALKASLSNEIMETAIESSKAKEGDAYADGLVVRAPL